ncbi:condensation domain-containing protein [Ensifer sp. BR816]|uniref:condensation domain-containing protein n=1 Tax=Rhizobium sp. (strain BR816) TaxID=1057002 RepID=UPI000366CD17|nr:condensation domain-containing protein [Ensifer sp. BR816]
MSEAIWAADLRRASHVQEAHIANALEAAGEASLPPSWLGTVFDLPAELDADAFAAALCDWTDRHEALRSDLSLPPRSTPGGRLHRRTLPPRAVSIHRSAAADFTDGRRLARYLEDLFDAEVGPLGWPAYICATISRPKATTVCLAADHILMDGYSICTTAYEIHTLYDAALAARDGKTVPPALPPAASYLDFAEAERTEADMLTADDESIARWRHFLAEAGGCLPEFPVPVSDVSGSSAAQPSGYIELLDATAAHAFDTVCRKAGGDTFSGLLACLAKAGHEISGSGEFRTMVPFHTRTTPFRSSIGWYVGMGPVAFPLAATDSFSKAVNRAASNLDWSRNLARIPIPRVADLLGQPLRDPFMVSYMDLRRTPGARDWNTWQVLTLRSRSTDPDEVCLWIVRTFGGLAANYRHPASGPAGIAVPDYMARTKHIVASVASTACWPGTPHRTGDHRQ